MKIYQKSLKGKTKSFIGRMKCYAQLKQGNFTKNSEKAKERERGRKKENKSKILP